ncbi:MAG: prepilin-type N-terminal cleavage/methylation domain-containing protein [Rhodocyclaceae bacterium]|nr:prepilin-type N-terminal cleavage/methylation domain-containing protein [Rhodocyclaceae bacterium]
MKAARGFTLIEVLIAMVVIGILAAIAIPSYATYIAKARRGTAQTCATEVAQFLERNYTLALRYDQDSAGNAVALPGLQCRTDLTGNFTFSMALAQTTYTVTATPSSQQSSADKGCGCSMTLNNIGVKGVGSGCSKTVADCWK